MAHGGTAPNAKAMSPVKADFNARSMKQCIHDQHDPGQATPRVTQVQLLAVGTAEVVGRNISRIRSGLLVLVASELIEA